jgi:hypothetical protein
LESLESLKFEIDDYRASEKTTSIPGQQWQQPQRPSPVSKNIMKPTPITALSSSISGAEYVAFCNMCFRERICIGSREDAARLKAKFVGTVNDAPAWLQLRAFPRQDSPGLWLSKSRENVILEMTRQMNTMPEMTKQEKTTDIVRRKLLEGLKWEPNRLGCCRHRGRIGNVGGEILSR